MVKNVQVKKVNGQICKGKKVNNKKCKAQKRHETGIKKA